MRQSPLHTRQRPGVYPSLCLSFSLAVAIVFANKAVLSYYNFKFVIALTLIHTVRTQSTASYSQAQAGSIAEATPCVGDPRAGVHMGWYGCAVWGGLLRP